MHRIAILAVDHVAALDIAIPAQVFTTAHVSDEAAEALLADAADMATPFDVVERVRSTVSRNRLYDVFVCADRSNLAVMGVGVEMFRLTSAYGLADAVTADTVIVPGGPSDVPPPEAVLDVIRAAHARGARIASICSGAFLLAAAGLLDGRRATTHWTCAAALAARFPRVEVDPDVLFIDHGDVLTSAGAATGLDMCLHMVRRDFGSAVAAEVARHVVVAPQRDGGQAQFIVHSEPGDTGGSLEPTMRWLRDRIGEPVTLAEIAQHATVSTRTLNRRFREQAGTTPLKWLLRQRVHRAQELLETTTLSIEEIATRCGFGTATNLRQHFTAQVRTSPMAYRRAFQAPDLRAAAGT